MLTGQFVGGCLSEVVCNSYKVVFSQTSSQIVQNTQVINENELRLVQKAPMGVSLRSKVVVGRLLVLLGCSWLFFVVLCSHKVVFTQTNAESFQYRQEEDADAVGFQQKQAVQSAMSFVRSVGRSSSSLFLDGLLVVAKEAEVRFH